MSSHSHFTTKLAGSVLFYMGEEGQFFVIQSEAGNHVDLYFDGNSFFIGLDAVKFFHTLENDSLHMYQVEELAQWGFFTKTVDGLSLLTGEEVIKISDDAGLAFSAGDNRRDINHFNRRRVIETAAAKEAIELTRRTT